MCHDGGDSLECDSCERILCIKHIADFVNLSQDQVNAMEFVCPSCHIYNVEHARQAKRTGEAAAAAYKVSTHGEHKCRALTIIQAFYMRERGVLKPIFKNGVQLHVARPIGQHARVKTEDTLVIELRLASMRKKGSVASVVSEAMSAYFLDE